MRRWLDSVQYELMSFFTVYGGAILGGILGSGIGWLILVFICGAKISLK